MQMSLKDAERVLNKLQIEDVNCKHHRAGFLVVDGVRILKIHHSFGNGSMPPTVVHLFRKSLKLSLEEFQKLVGCTTSREVYIQILRENGHIPKVSGK